VTISGSDAATRLREALNRLQPSNDTPPQGVVDFWPEIVRLVVDGWADGLARDIDRAELSLSSAQEDVGAAPTDDQVAALEECFWRLTSATDKVDAIVSLVFGGQPFVVVADKPREITMRPSRDRNKAALREYGSEAAENLIQTRAALSGERARLRRHQVAHSLAPIHKLSDLGAFVRADHRDGRIFGYELVRWTPARWDEGIKELTAEALFGQRLTEAQRYLETLIRTIEALTDTLIDAPTLTDPQLIYFDHDTQTYATTRPSSTGPPKSYEIDCVLDETDAPKSRRVSSPSKLTPGIEILFDDGVWRVIRTADGEHGADQTAICRLVED
jgi:hypothetical protein